MDVIGLVLLNLIVTVNIHAEMVVRNQYLKEPPLIRAPKQYATSRQHTYKPLTNLDYETQYYKYTCPRSTPEMLWNYGEDAKRNVPRLRAVRRKVYDNTCSNDYKKQYDKLFYERFVPEQY